MGQLNYKVNWDKGELCTGVAWTKPKYRKLGLAEYSYYKRLEYAYSLGAIKTIGMIGISNNGVYGMNRKMGAIKTGIIRGNRLLPFIPVGYLYEYIPPSSL